ncbi:ABC transporter family protein [Mycobacterium xenopi 4042]|uniref:ABC transporter family protein n=1 Tax=Mycobacterium xenopi 4042 TaxID=1299334 RepID=X8BGF5_MYCXE|nr:ABC transporter family protein [Mycobacterium xenopi 4042]
MSGLRLRAVVADRGLDVEFSVEPGEVLAVLGPNGAGKSTALHVIAGLVRPDEGLVRLGERVLTDTATGIDIATHNRRVGLLPQDPLLFPHLSVAANVAFGLRHSGRRDGAACVVGAGSRRGVGCAKSTPRSWLTAGRGSSPAARRSVSRSHGRWRPNRMRCCSTNRSPASTSARPARSARCCARLSAATRVPPCW